MKDSDLMEILKAQNKKIKDLEAVIESMQTSMEAMDSDIELLSKAILKRGT